MFGKGLHHIPGLPQTYVRVLFDFEYIDQEKKRVLMRENEVLLLLSKTNVDWWQVIRRGERRPFYAPAKYVLEMRTDPPPVVDTRYYKPCTTFGFPHKRSSYAPPSGSTVPPPAALDARFHPRYRSNSLDSILVSDQTKAMITLRDIPTRPPYLEKRPTIEALDKRKSWNILDAPPPRLQGRLAAYQNHTPFLLHRQTSKAKKPVPLPRASNKSVAEPPPKALGKRSKTDLTLDGLKAYKANRNSSKLVIPKLPVEERDPFKVPEKPLLSTFGVKRKSAEEPLSRVLSESNLVVACAEEKTSTSPPKGKENQEKFVKSEPLIIMTQPLNDSTPGTKLASSLESSGGEDLTKSSSFDSCFDDTSLDDSAMLSLITICDEKSSRYIDDTASSLSPDMKSPVSTTSRSPPSPSPNMTPTRNLMVEWEEYCDEKSGRKFYYNSLTKEKSWKPPRKSKGWSEGYSAPNSPDPESDKVKRKLDLNDVISAHFLGDDCDEVDQNISNHEVTSSTPTEEVSQDSIVLEEEKEVFASSTPETKKDEEPPIPDGYERHKEEDNNFYINIFTGVRWYSAKDLNGKVYFYEENGNESCWTLPNVAQSIQDPNNSSCSSDSSNLSPESVRKRVLSNVSEVIQRSMEDVKAKQEEHQRRHEDTNKCFVSSPNFQIGCVSIVVLKQGPLNKTKIFENGKKQRKNWCSSHIVLTDTFLLFFKDAKAFASMQNSGSSGSGKPEHVVDLKGTLIEWCKGDKSKRSYVFEVTSALFGLSVLLQGDSLNVSADWFREINNVIEKINGVNRNSDESKCGSLRLSGVDSISSASSNKVSRTKSIKMKFLGSSEELESPPLSGTSPPATFDFSAPYKSNIREKLKKFFLRRPTMDDLFKRGIIKNEPVFGSTLKELQTTELSDIPLFVKKCVREIEKGDHLSTDGVYRQSGNLSTIQKIRLQVDQGNLIILETVDDVHVLTGALKLFFRELKEPLIPWECVDALLQVPTQPSRKSRIKALKDILSKMPLTNRSTLTFLLKHLTRVTEFKESNRMQIHNLAIVFGPTLMWPPPHLGASNNLALDMMQQNIIVETLLSHVNNLV
uniref:Rho GTPaseactivating protein 12like [Acyrthosiphon pisum] n=1 Tax=Lepeophtheirus salmonis TaxID=72036 RepID=A0A0K2SVR7_LEPSM